MPPRNLLALLLAAAVSAVCFVSADGAHRSQYGRMFDTFVEVVEEVDEHYIEHVDNREMFEGALAGMIDRLDPYSAYLGPAEAKRKRESIDQQFGGIGIEVGLDRQSGLLTVFSPIYGTPAYEHGILAGDSIVSIDGQSTEGFSLDDATRLLRGRPGEPVRLAVIHAGQKTPTEISLPRAEIHVQSVLGDRRRADGSWDFRLGGARQIGYLRVNLFAKNTVEELDRALQGLQQHGMRGLVLDLRNNAGGLLSAAVGTADLFVPQGRIVSTRGRGGSLIDEFDASGRAAYSQVPMAVLVNQFSASASEIVAACLQDHGRAAIVGVRSFGKGTVQAMIPIEDGRSDLRLTIATYWRPSGKNIHRGRTAKPTDAWGVSPDPGCEVVMSSAELSEMAERRRLRDRPRGDRPRGDRPRGDRPKGRESEKAAELPEDPQLLKALECLEKPSQPSPPHG
jgi:carboxyl-terminal processing protease